MATLYLARRKGAEGFARFAAVKVVHPHLAKQERFRRMFVDEAKISAEVHHPNVVRIEDFGEYEGTFFMAMEYVHGCSLAEFLHTLAKRKSRLVPKMIAHVGAEIAAGLHAAHEASDPSGRPLMLVHRDISPSNVLISYTGHVKLIDFGVAKARFRSQETTGQSLKGKISYMSPEQANARQDLDRRTDIYALGIVLWEALTMRRAFTGVNDIVVLQQVQDPHLPNPSALASTPAELDDVVMKALATDREERFGTALALRRALLRAVPDALDVEPGDLSALIAGVMDEQRRARASQLPTSVSQGLDRSLAGPSEQSEERMGARLRALMTDDPTITANWSSLESDEELIESSAVVPATRSVAGESRDEATVVPPTVELTPSDLHPVVQALEEELDTRDDRDARTPMAASEPLLAEPTPALSIARGGLGPKGLWVIGLAGLAMLTGAVIAIGLMNGASEETDIRATPLAPRTPQTRLQEPPPDPPSDRPELAAPSPPATPPEVDPPGVELGTEDPAAVVEVPTEPTEPDEDEGSSEGRGSGRAGRRVGRRTGPTSVIRRRGGTQPISHSLD